MKTNLDFNTLNNIWDELLNTLPLLLWIVVYIVVSWLLLKFVLFLVSKSLKLTNLDAFISKINDKSPLNRAINPTKVVLAFVKWFMFLLLVVIGADIFGLTMVSGEIGKLVQYLPKLFSAALIFFLGVYGAIVLRKIIQSALKAIDMNGSKIISHIIFYFLFVMVSIMALNQAGIDTTIITNNVTFIIGAFLTALALALGLGSRDVVLRLLLGFYSRKTIPVGKRIRIGDVEGTVLAVNNISLVLLQMGGNKIVIPIKQIANKQIEILEDFTP